MSTVPLAQARQSLSGLLDRVQAGEQVVISRHGRPVARLISEPTGQVGAELWLELEGELDGLAQRQLLDDFLAERCPVVCFEPDDFSMVRHRQRHRPGIAPLPLLLQLQLAFRLGLVPVTFDRAMVDAAGALFYPVETLGCAELPCFTSSTWGSAERKPSCS